MSLREDWRLGKNLREHTVLVLLCPNICLPTTRSALLEVQLGCEFLCFTYLPSDYDPIYCDKVLEALL